jgi:hypothetical protein
MTGMAKGLHFFGAPNRQISLKKLAKLLQCLIQALNSPARWRALGSGVF